MKKFLFLVFLIGLLLISCNSNHQETYNFFAMDTIISLTFYNVDDSKEIAGEVEDIYLKYDAVASDFSSGRNIKSVYDLNKERSVVVNEELKELIDFALEMGKKTDGYYNPFIGRLSHLWKEALAEGKLLTSDVILEELAVMHDTSISFDGFSATLVGDGNLDLGGIAKGYATNKAKEYLASIDCHSYLLNAGFSNIVLGDKFGECFSVGLLKATGNGYFYTLNLKDKSIGTSSIREQSVLIDGKYYSHLLNAKTGYPATDYDSISIIGDNSAILDAYSTACFSMPLEELKEFLALENLDFIVSKDNRLIYKSLGVDDYA